jgi:hypothetical protein
MVPSRTLVRSYLAQFHDIFAALADCEPLDEDQQELVCGMRVEGKSRWLRRLLLGVTASLSSSRTPPLPLLHSRPSRAGSMNLLRERQ